MSKLHLKKQVVKLRKLGKSYSEINKIVPVSKSSLSLWLRDISLSKKHRERLRKRKTDAARIYASAALRNKRIIASKNTIINAWDESKKLMTNPLFILGTSLYWAEGGKTQEFISLSNSDEYIIKSALKWLRDFCNIPKTKIKAQLHIHSLHSRIDAEKYWSKLTDIPLTNFNKTYIKKTSLKHRKNILYNGTLIIRVHNSGLFRKFIGWKLGILECLGLIKFTPKEKLFFLDDMVKNKKYKSMIDNQYNHHVIST